MDQNNPFNTPTPTANKPNRQINDEQAQSLLAVNSLASEQKTKGSKKFLFLIIAGIIIIIAASLIIESTNKSKSSNPGSFSLPTRQNSPFNSNNNSNSVNKELKYCSNPTNALLTC